jgi:hypothetical protein
MERKDVFILKIKRRLVDNCINKILQEIDTDANNTKIIFYTAQLVRTIDDFFKELDRKDVYK